MPNAQLMEALRVPRGDVTIKGVVVTVQGVTLKEAMIVAENSEGLQDESKALGMVDVLTALALPGIIDPDTDAVIDQASQDALEESADIKELMTIVNKRIELSGLSTDADTTLGN